MTRYVWANGKWVKPGPRKAPSGPFIWRDLPAYKSPLGTGVIDGRRARREDLARAECREVDPSEKLDLDPKTEKDAARERAYLDERAANPYSMPEEHRERLMRGT